jgi:hypothetical protein
MAFKLTYATMFNPPETLHKGFDKAVAALKQNLGKEYGMLIDGKEVFADEKFEVRSPINTDWVLGRMQKGNARTHRWQLPPPAAQLLVGDALPGRSAWPSSARPRN